jgi:histidinol phosphatase-like PHP family hydrolase
MKILNTEKEDYHVHSMNFSDGFNTIDEMVAFAGKIGMKKIVFADHSQASIDAEGLAKKTFRTVIAGGRWKNVINKVEVLFGVEADLLNEEGDICDTIQNKKSDFIILSYHRHVYKGDKKNLTRAFINAIERHHEKIKIIGHLHISALEGVEIDVAKIVDLANKYKIPLELNCKYFSIGEESGENPENAVKQVEAIKLMLSEADQVYVNSDAHTFWELKELRKLGFKFLKDNGFLK